MTGNIPTELGSLLDLRKLNLNSNDLTGSIPSQLGDLTALRDLSLGGNNLEGNIPTSLGGLDNLLILYLYKNQLTGGIPAELGSLSKIEDLDLRGNQLTGIIPDTFSGLTTLFSMDIGYNSLYTQNSSLVDFLTTKQADWETTQTIAPANLKAGTPSLTSVPLSWNAIDYISGSGGYEVYYSTALYGTYIFFNTTDTKSNTSMTVTDLTPGIRYYFRVRTVTDPHSDNPNTVYSEDTPAIGVDPLDSDNDDLPGCSGRCKSQWCS